MGLTLAVDQVPADMRPMSPSVIAPAFAGDVPVKRGLGSPKPVEAAELDRAGVNEVPVCLEQLPGRRDRVEP